MSDSLCTSRERDVVYQKHQRRRLMKTTQGANEAKIVRDVLVTQTSQSVETEIAKDDLKLSVA